MLEVTNIDITAISVILAALESPHTTFHIDGSTNKRVMQSIINLERLKNKLLEHMKEQSQKLTPIGDPKPLDDPKDDNEDKEEKTDKKKEKGKGK